MATKTVGFAIEEADSPRLERLVERYGGGNRSAFLRVAIDYLEAADRAERLRKLQAYGATRSAEKDAHARRRTATRAAGSEVSPEEVSSAPPSSRNVVFDINVLVGAVVGGNSPFRSWPSPPPVSDNPFADCLGIVNHAREFALWVGEHILVNVVRVLIEGFAWDIDRAEEYAGLLVEIAEASNGGIVVPEVTVSDCPDDQDNRILECALASSADLIVSEDEDLTSMSPWRGIPIVRPREFASRVDAARRATRKPRGRRPS